MNFKRCMLSMIMAAGLLSMTGCAGQGSQTNQPQEQKPVQNVEQEETKEGVFQYSCLVDSKTQEEVREQLLNAGIQEESVDVFFQWVNEYNNNVKTASALQDGYQVSEVSPVAYEDLELKEEFDEDGKFLMDMNCRLTAYRLMRQFITTNQSITEFDPYLVFDVEELESATRFASIVEDRNQFITLYNPVDVKKDSKIEEHIEAIKKAWDDRGIQIEENEAVSLITMYLHDNMENKRFVGHAAVMVNTEDGILLVEKYGWNMPFQCTKFDTEEQMTEYLLSRPDLVGDGTEEAVIVMKNDTVISQ